MVDLAIGVRYLTGYAVVTYPTNRERAEWPPHPARIFMAMVAACFEAGEETDEVELLRWLEALPYPILYASDADDRLVVTSYVPVNDKPTGNGVLQSVPGLMRNKQPRTFPRVRPHNDTVYLHWPDVELNGHRQALEQLCSKVTRIGHSSSLVQMWVADEVPESIKQHCWKPDDLEANLRLRVFSPGSLNYLEQLYGEHERQAYHDISQKVEDLKEQKKTIRGKGSSDRKAKVQQEIDELNAQLQDMTPRDPLRPVMGLWQGYSRPRPALDPTILNTIWNPYIVIRRLVPIETQHNRLDLVSTLQVTTALHQAVIEMADDPVPEFISGHKPDGSPSENPHLAFLPLAFVGNEYATGHLLGVAIAVPDLNREQRRQALAAVGQVEELTIGRLGKWKLDPDDQGKFNLRAEPWTGGNDGATQWATVTPIAFDKHPKAKDRVQREEELADMIKKGCQRIGLPKHLIERVQVILTPVSPHLGVPAAHEFPRLKRKDGSERRHTHAILIFDQPVRGPIALCAGRYRGYGFCRPLRNEEVI